MREKVFIERFFPIKGERAGDSIRSQGEVPWGLAELAFTYYAHESSVSLEDIADKGGWTWSELCNLLTAISPRSGSVVISQYRGVQGKKSRTGAW